jgi:hypothetical protein
MTFFIRIDNAVVRFRVQFEKKTCTSEFSGEIKIARVQRTSGIGSLSKTHDFR